MRDDETPDTHGADVQLVRACLAGDVRALAELDARIRAVAPRALSGMRLGALSADDVLQEVREKLLVAKEEAPPKLGTYAGTGPLDGWLRVTVARAAISLLRLRGNAADVAGKSEDEALLESTSADPAFEALRARCAPTLGRAIERAVAALPDADRALLRLHTIDGLTIDDLAGVYSAHRATMARRLARVRSTIFEAARADAMRELRIDEAEFESLMGVMLSRIDVTIRRLVAP